MSNNLSTFRILFIIKGVLATMFSFVPLLYVFLGGFMSYSEEFMDEDIMANEFNLEAFLAKPEVKALFDNNQER